MRHPVFRRPAVLPLLLGAVALTLASSPLAAQVTDLAPRTGTVQGTVIDAATTLALPGSQVTIIPRDGSGAMPPEAHGAAFSNARTTTTAPDGAYRFTGLTPGEYTLLVRRVGYDPARIEVSLPGAGDARLSIGLVVLPVRLAPVSVEAAPDVKDSDSVTMAGEMRRVAAARERQRLFLSSDVREVTTADVHEAVTLGSEDVLRAMHRLPSVNPTNGVPFAVRGARWPQTRIYFDGIPLFEPIGGLGAVSGVSALSVGAAFLHPGVRPVSLGGEGVTRLDLMSPAGIVDGKVHGSGEISFVGFSGSVSHRTSGDAAGIHIAGRRSLGHVYDDAPAFRDAVPPWARFGDLTGRADAAIGAGRIEASVIRAYDRRLATADWRGIAWQVPDSQSHRTTAGGVTLSYPVAGLMASYSATVSRLATLRMQHQHQGDPDPDDPFAHLGELIFTPVTSGVSYFSSGVRLMSRDSSHSAGWAMGVDVTSYRSEFGGARQHLFWGELSRSDTTGTDAITYGSLWGERRWTPTGRLDVQLGLHADVGGSDSLAPIRPAASLLARFELTPSTGFSMGAARTHQYTQHLTSPNPGGPWIVASDDTPLLTIDQATVGLEHWQSTGHLLSANVYARHARGAALADPLPGVLTNRPLFQPGTETGVGVELSARRLTGRVTGMVAYSFGRARAEVDGFSFVSPDDRTHAIDATAQVRLGAWQLGAAYMLMSGALFTPTEQGTTRDPEAGWDSPPSSGQPNSIRAPAYSRMDAQIAWTGRLLGSRVTLFGSLENALYQNRYGYLDSPVGCAVKELFPGDAIVCRDGAAFWGSRSMTPSIGLRLRF